MDQNTDPCKDFFQFAVNYMAIYYSIFNELSNINIHYRSVVVG